MNNDDFTVLVSGGGRRHWVSMCTVWPSHSKWLSEKAMNLHQFCIKLEHSSAEIIWMTQKALAMGNWWLAASSQQCACSCITSHAECFGKTSNHTGDWAPLQPRFGTLQLLDFPKLKSSLKGKRFQTIDEIQENTKGQLMAIRRTMWGPKVPTWKGTKVSLSYIQGLLYLVSSSTNASIFHSTWLDIFWTDLICKVRHSF